ncbi:related to MRP4 - mitochondrial ribosomal protein, small subunit [Cephalotrichum gorgonifer]|uniref:Related to MRP4 - mitochondrial ribosomal protein, small subunit n=1 Tax=Cephalotrichum gorgonifer TaxID=2041049 RepID=A0AAE8SXU2_9PEZI|nr:related to MRP4 - mitochondrial ribosomal protein, small subunit [Cephalotrichum gorgonifer]
MILRGLGARHGRKALSTPIARASLRNLTTSSPRPAQTLQEQTRRERREIQHAQFADKKLKAATKAVGSDVDVRYSPGLLLKDPPKPNEVTLEGLMAAQTHMGHHASLWNPANSRYIYGVRQGIHIISLETTAAHLRRAASVVEEVTYRGGLVLFVGTRKGQMDIVTSAAKAAKACHLFTKWTPGSITNRDIILRDRPIKIVDELDRPLAGFDRHVNESRPLVPDLVVCLNPLENYTMLYECGLQGIPTIGVIDTDADPSWVTYTIPANDDSLRSTAFIAGVLGQAGKAGQKRRLASAAGGDVTWKTPDDVSKFIRGMVARRGEILSSLIDKEIIGGLKEPSRTEEPAASLTADKELRAAQEAMEAELKAQVDQDAIAQDLLDEEDELINQLTADSVEMDAMAAMEQEILESFKKEKAKATDDNILSKVGVEKGVPETEQKKPGKDE